MKSYRQIGNVWDPEDEKRMVGLANLKAPPGPTAGSDGAEGGMGEPVLVGGSRTHSPRSNIRPFDNPVSPKATLDINNPN
jgi:hypothetical protein